MEDRVTRPDVSSETASTRNPPSFREAIWAWMQVAAYSFGGPAGQISVMYRLIVEDRGWVSERRFLHALNYTMILPGPEAQQLAVYQLGKGIFRKPRYPSDMEADPPASFLELAIPNTVVIGFRRKVI